MALDTAAKRRAAAGVRRKPGVTPDAAKPAAWRYRAARNHRAEPTAAGVVSVAVSSRVPTVTATARG